jgi:hypothetical protein
MMKRILIVINTLIISVLCFGQKYPEPMKMKAGMTEIWEPEVKIIQPGEQPGMPPSDAIILFDGTDINKEWANSKGNPSGWKIEDGTMVCVPGSGGIYTKRKFNDFQLHVEWRTPSPARGTNQDRGNSGVYLQALYEVQVLDNYNNRTYRNGQAGSIYKQYAPLVNVCRKPGEWQTYDIIFTAPRFEADSTAYFTPPRVTVLQNGVLIQNNVSLSGPTLYEGIPEYSVKKHGAGPLMLQDHDHPVAYRNIWIREL